MKFDHFLSKPYHQLSDPERRYVDRLVEKTRASLPSEIRRNPDILRAYVAAFANEAFPESYRREMASGVERPTETSPQKKNGVDLFADDTSFSTWDLEESNSNAPTPRQPDPVRMSPYGGVYRRGQ